MTPIQVSIAHAKEECRKAGAAKFATTCLVAEQPTIADLLQERCNTLKAENALLACTVADLQRRVAEMESYVAQLPGLRELIDQLRAEQN